MKIPDKRLRIIYFLNIALIIISFIILSIISFITHDFVIFRESISLMVFMEIVLIGSTLGLLFLIINVIIIIKYKKIETIIIFLITLLWVIFSYHFFFFGALP